MDASVAAALLTEIAGRAGLKAGCLRPAQAFVVCRTFPVLKDL
jgi:hypothetical protein